MNWDFRDNVKFKFRTDFGIVNFSDARVPQPTFSMYLTIDMEIFKRRRSCTKIKRTRLYKLRVFVTFYSCLLADNLTNIMKNISPLGFQLINKLNCLAII